VIPLDLLDLVRPTSIRQFRPTRARSLSTLHIIHGCLGRSLDCCTVALSYDLRWDYTVGDRLQDSTAYHRLAGCEWCRREAATEWVSLRRSGRSWRWAEFGRVDLQGSRCPGGCCREHGCRSWSFGCRFQIGAVLAGGDFPARREKFPVPDYREFEATIVERLGNLGPNSLKGVRNRRIPCIFAA
jgi:hypothetical protein